MPTHHHLTSVFKLRWEMTARLHTSGLADLCFFQRTADLAFSWYHLEIDSGARRHSQLLESSSHMLMDADLNLLSMQDGQIDDKLPSRQNGAGSA